MQKVRQTTPVNWEMSCLEEVCGACSMVINGRPRQSCTALVDQFTQPIKLEPMKTFPVVRDLIVDREFMFDSLKKIKAWVPIDGTYDLGEGPRMPERKRQWAYELSKCMTCGVCLEACPNVNDNTNFMGPALTITSPPVQHASNWCNEQRRTSSDDYDRRWNWRMR